MKKQVCLLMGLFITTVINAQGFSMNGTSLYYNNGNVGIGAVSPTERLMVKNGNVKFVSTLTQQSPFALHMSARGVRAGEHRWTTYVGAYQESEGTGISSNGYEIWEYPQLTSSSATGGMWQRRFVIETNRDKPWFHPVVIGPYGGLNIGYDSNFRATDKNDLSVNGNVGIGTLDTKGYKLSVNGTVRAKEVVVNTGWADFVFKKDYHLPTLDEVEQHINEKGHLPNIPSEAEVEANGIGIGDMNAKLLLKIEELTLYVIQLQKEVNELKGKK